MTSSTLATVAALAVFVVGTAVAACGSSSSTGGTSGTANGSDGGGDVAEAGRPSGPIRPAGACPITIEAPELLATVHLPVGTAITWNSNPPSSGGHFPQWAHYQEFATPVPRGYLVHSLEHGGIVLAYKCEGATCSSIIDGLKKVREAVPTDSRCEPSIRARVLITPDPLLDVPVAAAAWGWTYKADCVDLPTLTEFARAHYAQGPEDVCAAGLTSF